MLASRVMASSSAEPGVLAKKVKHWLGSYCRFTSGVIGGEDKNHKPRPLDACIKSYGIFKCRTRSVSVKSKALAK